MTFLGEMFKLKLNYYTHVITLLTTLKQAFLLSDPVSNKKIIVVSLCSCFKHYFRNCCLSFTDALWPSHSTPRELPVAATSNIDHSLLTVFLQFIIVHHRVLLVCLGDIQNLATTLFLVAERVYSSAVENAGPGCESCLLNVACFWPHVF